MNKYRPYKDINEFELNHKNRILFKNNERFSIGCYIYDWGVNKLFVHGIDDSSYDCCHNSFDELFRLFTYEDGTPCGMKI